ncbi:MAG TPA: hypothetical protein VK811_06095 [Candidatus Acidoferrum sp.]|jgi:hypothetical protein|nr:hypothetical protein [Candidatus Acidoferrum sp.]
MNAIAHGLSKRICIISLLLVCAATGRVCAQSTNDETPTDINSIPDQVAALQLQLTNAWHQVEGIVCKPPPAYSREPGYHVAVYGPGGWFHPGASMPDFNNVDVRQSQEFPYASHPWVTSDASPTMMFHGSDLEFNAMIKLFYTNRSLPKRKLSEAEMLQINSLYRTIGHCQTEIAQLQPPPEAAANTDSGADDTDNGTNSAAPPQAIAAIESIPQQTRILYGSIAIGTLLVLVIAFRLLRKKSD